MIYASGNGASVVTADAAVVIAVGVVAVICMVIMCTRHI